MGRGKNEEKERGLHRNLETGKEEGERRKGERWTGGEEEKRNAQRERRHNRWREMREAKNFKEELGKGATYTKEINFNKQGQA